MSLVHETDYGTPASRSAEQVTLTIDGQQVTVAAGTSIMRAAMDTGIQVPKLCATDSVEAFGSCRLCLVEISGRAGTPASCTTPVAPGMAVAVIGDGKLGLLCALALAATGHPPVLFGKHAAKLDHAARRGIETMHATAAPRRARSFDVVIEASGNASGFDLALELLRPLGTLVLKSTFHGRTPIDAARIVIDEVRVVGSRCGRFAPALALLAQGAIAVDDLITDVVGLDDAAAALARAGAPGVLKLLLAP